MSDTDTAEATSADTAEVASDDAPVRNGAPDEVYQTDTPDAPAAEDESSTEETEPDTFPRSYVEELRRENARYRERARNVDTYAKRLHTEPVRATGKLADPTDLEFAEDHLDDPDALAAALDDLLARKPHLASRRPTGEIGQGASPSSTSVDLAALLRQRAV